MTKHKDPQFQVGDIVKFKHILGTGLIEKDHPLMLETNYIVISISSSYTENRHWVGIKLPNLVGYEERVKLGLEPNWCSSLFKLVHRNTRISNILYKEAKYE